ncbi:hypothetical protein [Cohnella faecalis]|uniref:Uncharacterized protein n=1 Tax=Cohnella faecalis TaxID=2315694 RepID=A0A398CQ05_9BACL|nr:hypothetical protein [Cohnella faecalis]RIE01054.1 hypothetical protein D3H35_21715 [Cohnella faecalis]
MTCEFGKPSLREAKKNRAGRPVNATWLDDAVRLRTAAAADTLLRYGARRQAPCRSRRELLGATAPKSPSLRRRQSTLCSAPDICRWLIKVRSRLRIGVSTSIRDSDVRGLAREPPGPTCVTCPSGKELSTLTQQALRFPCPSCDRVQVAASCWLSVLALAVWTA